MSNGRKMAPKDVSAPGPDAPLAHRRPGYSLSGCTPAEPDATSPGEVILPRRLSGDKEAARAAFTEAAHRFGTPFNFIANTDVVVHSGAPIPAGRVSIIVQGTATAGL